VSLDVAHSFVRRGLEELEQLPDGPERPALEKIARSVVDRRD
jgi:geranylgeranyl pyrophosphate synthase